MSLLFFPIPVMTPPNGIRLQIPPITPTAAITTSESTTTFFTHGIVDAIPYHAMVGLAPFALRRQLFKMSVAGISDHIWTLRELWRLLESATHI